MTDEKFKKYEKEKKYKNECRTKELFPSFLFASIRRLKTPPITGCFLRRKKNVFENLVSLVSMGKPNSFFKKMIKDEPSYYAKMSMIIFNILVQLRMKKKDI